MADYTEKLNLLKKDPTADASDTFNIKTMLNDNWDKLDANAAEVGAELAGKVDKSHKLPNGTNLNDVTEPNEYYCEFDDAYLNFPTVTNAYSLSVLKTTSYALYQVFRPFHVDAIYFRRKYSDGWHDWNRLATATDLTAHAGRTDNPHAVTPAQIGAAAATTLAVWVPVAWTASGNYFYQNLSVPGMLASDNPVADILPGSDNAANKLYAEAWGKVLRVTTYDGAIVIAATEAPTVAFPVQFKVVR